MSERLSASHARDRPGMPSASPRAISSLPVAVSNTRTCSLPASATPTATRAPLGERLHASGSPVAGNGISSVALSASLPPDFAAGSLLMSHSRATRSAPIETTLLASGQTAMPATSPLWALIVWTGLPSLLFHSLTRPSAPAETTRSPLVFHTACRAAPSCRTCQTSDGDQRRADLSAPPVRTVLPSAAKTTALTAPSWVKNSSSDPVASKSRVLPSPPATARRLLSVPKDRPRTSAPVAIVDSSLPPGSA